MSFIADSWCREKTIPHRLAREKSNCGEVRLACVNFNLLPTRLNPDAITSGGLPSLFAADPIVSGTSLMRSWPMVSGPYAYPFAEEVGAAVPCKSPRRARPTD